jgi:cytochrome c-type biogenesis protein CcmH
MLLLIAALALPAVARADALDDQVREISKGLRCPVCSGESVADSHAPISVQMRGIIREKLEAGESPDQIRAYFVTRYGSEILLSPQTSGFTLGVWVMPIFALIIGFLIVLAVLRSWSRRGEPVAAPPSAATADEAVQLPPDDDALLERELSRFRQEHARGGGVS